MIPDPVQAHSSASASFHPLSGRTSAPGGLNAAEAQLMRQPNLGAAARPSTARPTAAQQAAVQQMLSQGQGKERLSATEITCLAAIAVGMPFLLIFGGGFALLGGGLGGTGSLLGGIGAVVFKRDFSMSFKERMIETKDTAVNFSKPGMQMLGPFGMMLGIYFDAFHVQADKPPWNHLV